MPCDWGVKTDMVLFASNTVLSISERVRCVCVDALYKSMFTLLYFTFTMQFAVVENVQFTIVLLSLEPATMYTLP